ncbi:MAG: PfkB family carbohydrate kinase [Candidatus Korobacteraceae bacterium]
MYHPKALTRVSSTHPRALFIGIAAVDAAYPVDTIPGPNEKLSVPSQRITAGGPATNAAVTFAFLGGHSSLVTAVGAHPLGSVIRQDLSRFSVSLHDVARDQPQPPPVSSIMVINGTGERSVVSANAAAFPALRAQLHSRWFQGVSIVEVDGHYMPLCIEGARRAHGRGIPVVLDSGSWKDGMAELLPFVDIAICSDDYRPPGCRAEQDVIHFLAAQGIRQIAITRGSHPILFMDHDRRDEIPVEQLHPVDTLGAGDIFHGAFCYDACQPGHSFRQALMFAARVASFSCRHFGTRSWMKSFPQIEPRRDGRA